MTTHTLENEVRMPEACCPSCEHTLDAATSADGSDQRPQAGDLSVCFYCASVLMFNDDFTLRQLSGEEFDALAGQAWRLWRQLKRAQAIIRALHAAEARKEEAA